jgi:hypothetical protein
MVSKVTVGGNLVIASGCVLVAIGQEVTVVPIVAGMAPLTFRFAFVNAGGDSNYRIEPAGGLLNGNIFRVVLNNFNNSLGQGLTSPVLVGTIAGRQLYLVFAAYMIGQPPAPVHVLHYTFSLSGEQDV